MAIRATEPISATKNFQPLAITRPPLSSIYPRGALQLAWPPAHRFLICHRPVAFSDHRLVDPAPPLPADVAGGGRHRYAMVVILSSAPSTLTPPPRARRQPRSGLRGGLARLSGALGLAHGGAGTALAAPLSYEETLRLSSDSSGDGGAFSLPDLGLDGLVDFVAQNPLVVAAGLAAVALPLVLSQVLGGGGSKPYAVVSARAAYQRLLEEPDAQLVDIRPLKDAREAGAPDLREAKKKAVAVPYNGEDKNGFLKKLALRFKDPENTTLIILDKFDGNSKLVAELVTANGYKAAFAIKDGADGSRGWVSNNLPWKAPKMGFSFDFGELFWDGSDGLPVTISLAAATGLGVLAYTEIETVLQFLGSAAIVQLVITKLLYAEDRKKTLKQIEEFFNNKVAPKDLVDEIKEIGQALLPSSGDAKSQLTLAAATPAAATATAAPAEAAPAAATGTAAPAAEPTTESPPATPTPLSPYTNYPDLKLPSPPLPPSAEAEAEVKAESTATEAPGAVNSAPVAEASTESPPPSPRPLSPYTNYPDLKPPSSPSPSTP
ncbi:protein THYLAKOID RHODANESE-LIKE, chloroplastic-like [Phragmites australis]|uniref:protein THYLAKOID RHODANESE-LIKE, chloroplastic-like n=1 Tax=Phragmites australis TaxID=29695 RepID=UPI002D789D2F|nr:protein THYLAKOID RHODANESE-LIKE, chloroplastic-like [Phragmites australis]